VVSHSLSLTYRYPCLQLWRAHLNVVHSQQPPRLELRILTNGLYPQPPTNITSDELAYSAKTTSPPNPTSDFTCLLSGPLDNFLLYSGQEQSQWLVDIAHDICDPALERGSLRMWDAAGGTLIPLTL